MSESDLTSAILNETEMDEAGPGIEFSDNPDCFGDGKVCAECGKVFSHPFYFSTHISIHYSEKRFSVGQCNLCGLTFADPHVYQKHLMSSNARMSEQPPDEEDLKKETEFTPDYHSQDDQNFDENGETMNLDEVVVKQEIDADMSDELISVNQELVRNQDTDFEPSTKRRRKMTQRYEPELISGPSMVNPDTDPAVEAYLMSLTEMGLTVDPAAFANPRVRGRGRKFMGPSRGRWRGPKFPPGRDFMMADAFPPVPKKPSPKYEYLDYDVLLEDDVEILPKSGKQTRGQRLQQRQERLSQQKEPTKGQDGPAGSEAALKVEPGSDKNSESDSTAAVSATAAGSPVVSKALKRSLPSTSAGPSLVDRSFALDKQMIKAELTDKDYSPRASSHSKARGRGSAQKRGGNPAVQAAQVRASAPGAPRPGFTGYAMASPTFRPAVSLGSDVVRPAVNKVSRAGMATNPIRMKTVTATSSASSGPKMSKMAKAPSGIEKYKQESREYVEIMLQSLTDELIPTKMGKSSVSSKTYFGKSGDLSLGSSSSYSGNQSFFHGVGGTGGLMGSQRQNFGRGGLPTETYMYGSQLGQWSQPVGSWPMSNNGARGHSGFGLFNSRPPRARGARGVAARGGAMQPQRGAAGQRGRGGRGHGMMGMMPSTFMGPTTGVAQKPRQGLPVQAKPPLNPPAVYPVKMGRGGVGIARGGVSTARGGVSTARGGLAPPAKITPPPPVKVQKPAITTEEVIVLDDDDEDDSAAKGKDTPRKKQSTGDSSGAGPSGVTPVKKTAVIVDIDKEGSNIAIIEKSDKKPETPLKDSDKAGDKKLQLSPSVRLTRIDDVKPSVSGDKTPQNDHAETCSKGSPSGSEDNDKNGASKGEGMLEVEDIDGWKVCLAKDSESESDGESDQDSRSSVKAAGCRNKETLPNDPEAERPAAEPSTETQGGDERQPDPLKPHQSSPDASPDDVDNTKHKSGSSSRSDNSVLASHDTEDSLSSSVPSASSVPLTFPNFIGDTDNLLDIFSEIEKTCKEIEENSGNEREDSGAESDTKDLKRSESCNKMASSQPQGENSVDKEGGKSEEGKISEVLKNLDSTEQKKRRQSNARGPMSKHGGQRKGKVDNVSQEETNEGKKFKDGLNNISKVIDQEEADDGDDEEANGEDDRMDAERNSEIESLAENERSDEDNEDDDNKVGKQFAVVEQDDNHECSMEHDESCEQSTGRGYEEGKECDITTGSLSTSDELKATQLERSEAETNAWKSDNKKVVADCANKIEVANQRPYKKSDDSPVSVSGETYHKTLADGTQEMQDSVVVPCESMVDDGGKGALNKDAWQAEPTHASNGPESRKNEGVEMEDVVDSKGDDASVVRIHDSVEGENCTNDMGSKTDLVGPTHEERFVEDRGLEQGEGEDVREESEERKVEQSSHHTMDGVDSEVGKENNGSDEVTTGLEMAPFEPNRVREQGFQENENNADQDSKKKAPGRSSCKDDTLDDTSDHDSDKDKDGGTRNGGGGRDSSSSPQYPAHNLSGASCSNSTSSNSGDNRGSNSHSLTLNLTDSLSCATSNEGLSSFSGIHSTDFTSYLSPSRGHAMDPGQAIQPMPHRREGSNFITAQLPCKFPTWASYGASENYNKFHPRCKRSSSSSIAVDFCSFGRDFGETVLLPRKYCTKRNIQGCNDKLVQEDVDRSNEMPCGCDIASNHGIMSETLSCVQDNRINFPMKAAPQGTYHHFSKMQSPNQVHQKSSNGCCWCSLEHSSFMKRNVRCGCRKRLSAVAVCCKHSRNFKIVGHSLGSKFHSSLRSRLAKLLGSQLPEMSKCEMGSRPGCNSSGPALTGVSAECEMVGLTKTWQNHCRNNLLVEFQEIEFLENSLGTGKCESGSTQPKWLKSTRTKSWSKSLHNANTKSLSKYKFPLSGQPPTKDKTKVNQCLLNLKAKVQDCRKLLLKPIVSDGLGSDSGSVHFKAGFKEASSMNQHLRTESKGWPVRTHGQKNGKSSGRQTNGPANNNRTGKSEGCSRNNKRNYNSEDDDTGSDCDDSDNDNSDGYDSESAEDGVYQLVDCPICGIIFKHVNFVKRHISLKHKKWSLCNQPISSATPPSYVLGKSSGRPRSERAPTIIKLTESRQVSSNVYEAVVLESGAEKKDVATVKPTKSVLRMASGLEKKSKLDKCKSHQPPHTKITARSKASESQRFDTVGQMLKLTETIGVESEEKLDDHRENPPFIGHKPEQDQKKSGHLCAEPQSNNDDELDHCQEKLLTNCEQKDEATGKGVAADELMETSFGNDATSALMQVKLEACEGEEKDGDCPEAVPENDLQVKSEPVSDSEEELLTVTFDETTVSKRKTNSLTVDKATAASDSSSISGSTQQSGQAKSSDRDCSKDPLSAGTTLTSCLEESARNCTANSTRGLDGTETKIKLQSVVSLATGKALLKDMALCPPPNVNKLVFRNVGQSTPEKQEVIFVYPKKPVINFSSRCPTSPSTSHSVGQNTDPLGKPGRECRTKERLFTKPVSRVLSRKRKIDLEPQTNNIKQAVSTSTKLDTKRSATTAKEEKVQSVVSQNLRGATVQPSSVAGSSTDAEPSKSSTSQGQDNAYFPSQEWCVTGPTVIYVHPQKPIINFSGRAPRPCSSRSVYYSKLKNDA